MKYYEINDRIILRYPLTYLYLKQNNAAIIFRQVLNTMILAPSFVKTSIQEVALTDERYNGKGTEEYMCVLLADEDLWTACNNAVIIDPSDDTEKPLSDLGDTMWLLKNLLEDAVAYNTANPGEKSGLFNITGLGIYAPIAILDTTVPAGLPDREIYDEGGNVTGYHTFRTWGGTWVEGQNPDTSPSGWVLYSVYTPSRQGALNMSEIITLYDSATGGAEILFSVDKRLKLETDEFNYIE